MKAQNREATSPGERRLAALVRELAPRQAPPTLENRVLREIERCAARPWWRSSFAQWPGGARAAFSVFGVALVALCVVVGNRMADAFTVPYGAGMLAAHPAHALLTMIATTQQLWTVLSGLVPSGWARAALVAAIALYVSLFALGAAAYRWLYAGSGARPYPTIQTLRLSR